MSADTKGSAFGAKLQEWRQKSGKSQAQVETEIGKGRNYITRLEGGFIRTLPDRATCDALAQAIGVDPDALWEEGIADFVDDEIRAHYEDQIASLRRLCPANALLGDEGARPPDPGATEAPEADLVEEAARYVQAVAALPIDEEDERLIDDFLRDRPDFRVQAVALDEQRAAWRELREEASLVGAHASEALHRDRDLSGEARAGLLSVRLQAAQTKARASLCLASLGASITTQGKP